jgi:hypothetical protein
MMAHVSLALHRHPIAEAPAVLGLEAEAERAGERLTLNYRLIGDLAQLAIPPAAEPQRVDELWRRTCFEAFIRPEGGEGYLEINLAPSRAWAVYRLTGYREGLAPAPIAAPRIEIDRTDAGLALRASLDLSPLAGYLHSRWRVALAAVIEDVAGAISYWSLGHPPGGRPDFHADAGFKLTL